MRKLKTFKVRMVVVTALAAAMIGISSLVAPLASAKPMSPRSEYLVKIWEMDRNFYYMFYQIGAYNYANYWADKSGRDLRVMLAECYS